MSYDFDIPAPAGFEGRRVREDNDLMYRAAHDLRRLGEGEGPVFEAINRESDLLAKLGIEV